MSNISKAFGCINHTLIIAKLAAFVLDYDSISLNRSYLTGRKQKTKINNVGRFYSDIMCDITCDASQG